MRRKTGEEADWLAERYPSTPNAELLDAFEAEFGWRPTRASLMSWASDKGLRKDVRKADWKGHPEYDEFLRSFVPGHTLRETLDAFEDEFGTRLTAAQLANRKAVLGLRTGTTGGRFEPGHESWNKGRPAAEWASSEALAAMAATRFKPGAAARNARPVGDERTTKDGYVEVKVAQPRESVSNGQWVAKQRLVWEQAHGRPVPEGCAVLFAGGDKRNFDPDNLVCVTRAESLALKTRGLEYHDRESLDAALLVVRLHAAIDEIEMRPRACKRCGREFAPRYKHQRTCDACLGRGGRQASRQ